MRLPLFLAIAALTAIAAADFSLADAQLSVTFEGVSGHIRFNEVVNSGTDTTDWYKIIWSGIAECNAQGACSGNKVENFANAFVWGTEQDYTDGDARVLSVNGTAQPVVAGTTVTFIVFNKLYTSAANVTGVDNVTVTIPEHTFKFGFEVDNWPFAASANTLQVYIDVQQKGQVYEFRQSDGTLTFGRATIEFDEHALLDGSVVVDAVTSFTSNGGAGHGNGQGNGQNSQVTVQVPSFTQSVRYDPLLRVGASASLQLSLLVGMLSVMFATLS